MTAIDNTSVHFTELEPTGPGNGGSVFGDNQVCDAWSRTFEAPLPDGTIERVTDYYGVEETTHDYGFGDGAETVFVITNAEERDVIRRLPGGEETSVSEDFEYMEPPTALFYRTAESADEEARRISAETGAGAFDYMR